MFNKLYANEALKHRLSEMLKEGVLPHGILLCGEEGLGKGLAARLLAAEYLEPTQPHRYEQVLQDAHPECIVVQGTGVTGQIKVEQIREVRARVQETSFGENGKVVLIEQAGMLGSAAANALLKVLEEPPAGALFILTAPSVGAVLPTILSRLAVFSLSPLSVEECAAVTKQQFPGADAAFLSAVFDGRLGLCLSYAGDAERKEMLDLAVQAAKAVQRQNIYAACAIFSGIEKDKPAVKELLVLMNFIFFTMAKGGANGKLPTMNIHQAKQASNAIFEAQRALAQNANTKLTLTATAASF